MFCSNQIFSVNGTDWDHLEEVLRFGIEMSESKIESFREDPRGLIFCESESDDTVSYPFAPSVAVLVEHVKQYFTNMSITQLDLLAGKKPESEGIVEIGWEVFVPNAYGPNSVENCVSTAVLAVRPHWITYGR